MTMNICDSIEFVKKQFLCCIPLNKFKWPDSLSNISELTQRQIINETVNNEIVLKYPIKESYQKAFLKLLINKLEQSGVEIDDIVYNTYCDTVAAPDEQMLMHYRHFLLNDQDVIYHSLSIKESTNIISQGTTGLCSWTAGFHLAEWCISNKHQIQGKNILELGSGVGLTGLAIISYCAPKTYYFSDCHPVVLKTLEENVHLNLLNKENGFLWKEILSNDRIQFEKTDIKEDMKVEIMNLKWENIDELNLDDMELNLVVAADILYDQSTFEPLAHCLNVILNKTLSYAVVAATVRNKLTIMEFLTILEKYDLMCEEESAPDLHIFLQSADVPVKILKICRLNK